MTPTRHTTPALPSFGNRRNLREEITETLRAAVISGELRPGVVYSAPSLAEQFGVSSTPVREAMLDLVSEGLVEAVRNKGFRVTELSEQQLDDITHLPAVIERLRPLAAGIEDAARRRDLIAHVTIDMEFHLTLLGLTGNTYLVDTVRSLRSRSRIYGLVTLAEHDRLVPSSHEHSDLLDLIEARDADGAEQLMRQHLNHVRGLWADKG
jgi:DNA-binding GntR family transcriptional regulator